MTDDEIERFNSLFERSGADECWPWRAAKQSAGYGVFRVGGRAMLAHRIALEMSLGKPLGSRFALHSCDNPACVNPAHLRPGQQLDNVRDAIARGRHVAPPRLIGERHPSKRGFAPKGEAKVNTTLTEAIARKVWRLHLERRNATQISQQVGQTINVVTDLIRGRTFKHLHGRNGAPTALDLKKGGQRRAKLSKSDIEEALRMISAGMANKAIASHFGISATPISNLRTRGRTW